MSSKKYKLFKASDDGKAVPCAFFASAEGCRGGDKCRFLHELPSAPKREHVAAAVSVKRERAASVVSSESEGEGAGAISPPPVASATKASAKAKAPIAIVKQENSAKKPEKKKKNSPCAFFASPEGCKCGDKCRFLHEHVQPSAQKKERTAPAASSPAPLTTTSAKANTKANNTIATGKKTKEDNNNSAKKPEKKKNRRSGDGDIFAAPKGSDSTSPFRPAKKARHEQDQSNQSAQKAKTSQLASPPTPKGTPKAQSRPNSAKKAPKEEPAKTATPSFRQLNHPVVSFSIQQKDTQPPPPIKTPNEPSFRQLNLPVASFAIPGFELKGMKDTSPTIETPTEPEIPSLPLPKSTPEGRKWQDAVIKTRAHARYATGFDFQKLIAQDEANGSGKASDWIQAKPFGDWCKNNPQAIAIDCEMCETKDPATGSKNHRALCRISIVNADDPKEVLLDTLVKPAWPVSDYRTWVNGIEKKHLENVEFTMEHAQAFLMALCSEETVILGHAVYNDLAAMLMIHHCNVDSSYLFAVKDEPEANPGLKDITKGLLELDMPKTHDSVNDALMAFRCLEVWLEKDGKVEPVERTKLTKNKNATSQLFIHRIPKICQKTHLETMFLNHTSIQPVDVNDFDFNGEIGKTVATFASPRHANLAFASLEGEHDPDASGRLQKKVFLRSGGYIRVRKMVHEKGNGKAAAAAAEEASAGADSGK